MGISVINPIHMYCYNKSVNAITFNPVFHDCTKYIEVDYHITHKNMISLPYIPSEAQLADLFTKAQTSHQFRQVLSKLSVFDPPRV